MNGKHSAQETDRLSANSNFLLQKILDLIDRSEQRMLKLMKDQSEINKHLTEANKDIAEKTSGLPKLMLKVDQQDALIRQLIDQNVSMRRELDQLKAFSIPSQSSLCSSELVIAGIPRNIIDDSLPIACKVLESLGGTNLSSSSILGARKMPVRNQSSPTQSIVVTLKSAQVCDLVINKKRKKRDLRVNDVFTSELDGLIYVNELLPPDQYNLLLRAKAKAKANGYKYVWVKYRRISVRRGDGTPIISINCDADLDHVV